MSKASELGKTGEELAGTFLMKKKFRLLHRNWNLYKGYEIDIVAQYRGTLHFVEVKTRMSSDFGGPFAAVDERKMRHIYSAISHYRRCYRIDENEPFVFDVIGITFSKDGTYELEFREDVGRLF
ncbi:MAG: YraN family protein [Bacteroides sp.]|nr:YraN family protein [Roseburia sp.]MCM1346625.1 YraN family protein [Bacteroides sp.]MCM1421179.1 YraN family protein [Bacteroides sp.]